MPRLSLEAPPGPRLFHRSTRNSAIRYSPTEQFPKPGSHSAGPRRDSSVALGATIRGNHMYLDRGRVDPIVQGVLTLAFALVFARGTAQAADPLHFALGPLQPTPS